MPSLIDSRIERAIFGRNRRHNCISTWGGGRRRRSMRRRRRRRSRRSR
jgi:hypothetical protein